MAMHIQRKKDTKEGNKKGEKQEEIGFLQLVSIVKKSARSQCELFM